jgi:hypothetical protein
MVSLPRILAAVVVSAIGLPACSGPSPAWPSPKLVRTPEAPRHVYRLDYALKASDGTSSTVSRYSVGLEEGHSGEIRTGLNIGIPRAPADPLGPRGTARQYVGFVLKSSYAVAGPDLVLHCSAESSDVDEQGIRKLASYGDVVVFPGTPTQVMRIDDPARHVSYELEVTATRQR